MTLRTEHLSRAMGLQARCKGETPRGESGTIVAEREFWRQVEEGGGPRHPLEKGEGR